MSGLKKTGRRRALSMTSLIDVIFLLLLFFMLSSTFTQYGDLPFSTATGGAGIPAEVPAFLRLLPGALTLDTKLVDLDALAALLSPRAPVLVIVAPGDGVTAQQLVEVIAVLRDLPGVTLRMIGG